MKAMVLNRIAPITQNPAPLAMSDMATPQPGPGALRIRVRTCGVCHTELDEIEGRTPPPRLPVVLGHQAVGIVDAVGDGATRFVLGERVGVAWIYSACGKCIFCQTGRENLCADFVATGRDVNGGYAQYMVAPQDFACRIPSSFTDTQAAPLLCAGAIGYRSLSLSGIADGKRLGLTGFGASAHLVLQMVQHRLPSTRVFVFARNVTEQDFARQLGAVWAGDTEAKAPEALDAIIDTTPAWKPVVCALDNLAPGGRLVINAIGKINTDQHWLTKISYPRHIWMEKSIQSVANVTRQDVAAFLDVAAQIPIRPEIQAYPLEGANEALVDLNQRHIRGAKVLIIP